MDDLPRIEFKDRFVMDRILGAGKYGKVYLVREVKSNELYAIKMISTSQLKSEEINLLLREAYILRRLSQYPGISRYYDTFLTEVDHDQKIGIVMEYIEGYGFNKYIDCIYKYSRRFKKNSQLLAACYGDEMPLTREMIKYWMEEILGVIVYIHDLNVVHRDIKPANLMIDKNKRVKLIDFGFSCFTLLESEYQCTAFRVGSPLFMSPEVIKGKIKNLEIYKKADVWAFGITMYILVNNRTPFDYLEPNLTLETLVKALKTNALEPSTHPDPEINNVIHRALIYDPHKRPTARELLEEIGELMDGGGKF